MACTTHAIELSLANLPNPDRRHHHQHHRLRCVTVCEGVQLLFSECPRVSECVWVRMGRRVSEKVSE